jgi:ABC-type transport system involved in cytochrome c biogenesis permease component
MVALLALFIRSVRDDLRSKSLLWARIGIACAILFTIFKTRITFQFGGAPGLAFFSSVVWTNFYIICIAGVSYFSSSVTEEKEEGTLGLLRMTDLSPFAILLGKSTSRLVGGLLLLLVQLPFVMLAITMGGVALDQVILCYALLVAFLFFACNVGLLGSVIGRRTGSAAAASGVLGIIYLIWPWITGLIVAGFLQGGNPAPGLRQFVASASSIFFTPSVMGGVLRGGPVAVGAPILALLGGGLGAFLLARFCFERFCGEESDAARPAIRSGNHGAGRTSSARVSRRGRAWEDAVAWRDFHYLHGGPRMLVIKFLLYAGILAWFARTAFGSGFARSYFDIRDFFSIVLPFAFAATVFESLFSTSRIYRLERRNRTLASLYLLPQDIDALIRSKRRAVLLTLIPAASFVGLSCFVLFDSFLRYLNAEALVWIIQGLAFAVAQVFLLHYLVALFSLKMKWGGLPLALVLWWLGTTFVSSIFLMLLRMAGLFFLIIASVVIAIFVRMAFRRRLIAAVADE